MKLDREIIKSTYRNFKYNSNSVIYFEIIYKLLAMFIFIPLISYVLKMSMNGIGVYNVSNLDILKYSLTSQGMFYIAIVLAIAFVAVFIEIGILTYMAYNSHLQKKVSLLEGMINIISICPSYPSRYMIYLILLSGIAGPLTGIGLYNSLITRFTIPSFVKIELFKTVGGKLLYVAMIVGLILLLLRWLLAIPIMVIEKVSMKEAFVKSRKTYVKNKWGIISAIILWLVFNYVLRFIALGIIMFVTSVGIVITESNGVMSFMMMSGGIIVFFFVYLIVSVVTLPLFISFLVELYYSCRDYEAENRIFVDISYYYDKKLYKFVMKYNKQVMAVIMCIFIVVSSGLGISAIINNIVGNRVEITAHRGSSKKAPENSISAIKEAINDGADYAEIDVRTTKDDNIIVFHDGTLKRFDGSGRAIKTLTLEEIQKVDIGSSFSEEFAGEKIPTFEEVLKTAKGKIKLNIELKTSGKGDDLPAKVVDLLKEYQMEDNIVITSQDYDALQAVKQEDSLIRVGYILTFGVGDFTKMNVDFVSIEYGMLKKGFVYAMHGLDKEVHVWTINDAEEAESAIKLGADNIITDEPEMVRDVDNSIRYQKDMNYLTRFYDSVYSIMKHVMI